MKYRYLRIAFSITCGIACVLLMVLWVSRPVGGWFVYEQLEPMVTVSDSYVIALAAIFAVAPWLLNRRYSLRTLLITTTLIALALGLIIATTR